MEVLIFVLFIFTLWISEKISDAISTYRNNVLYKLKEQVYSDVKEGTNIEQQLDKATQILNSINYARKKQALYKNTPSGGEKIGLCPRCKIGFLRVCKKFAGYDKKYNRYPQYNKFLGCSEYPACKYTESYINLQKRKNKFKEGNMQEFLADFRKAYL